ncbi:MAG: tRNA (N(6)-L-threonylcarbamoyladenosine(37)-C(2))-methylthiotransferase MtaB [Clostridiales bacterium]|nr:tRNA (N(6)-L-threonylcarbamoyladenosine(37)-C(2))-methylthiotransferase MtaB [Clostridiales bacterium]
MTAAFYTLGCKVNAYETQRIMRDFMARGFEIVPFGEVADVYVINTCSVTSLSDAKSRKAVAAARRMNPEAIIGVVGCYAEVLRKQGESAENAIKRNEKMRDIRAMADVICGTSDKDEVVNRVLERMSFAEDAPFFANRGEDIGGLHERTRAVLKIQDGCDDFCTYCIIPHARGREKSRPMSEVLDEAKTMADSGFSELVLVGIHISSYADGEARLPQLVGKIAEIKGIERIRLGSLEPHDLNDGFIAQLLKQPKLCPHFHVSLQSGSDSVLRRMGRKYTFAEYRHIVEELRKMPNSCITTDVIVGFVGETDAEFAESLANVRKCGFGKIHVFPYSARKITAAGKADFLAKHGGEVRNEVKRARAGIMREVAAKTRAEFLAAQAGRTEEIIIEKDGGYTRNYTKVKLVTCIIKLAASQIKDFTAIKMRTLKTRKNRAKCRPAKGETVKVQIFGVTSDGDACLGKLIEKKTAG